jgi:hypothetical protein
MPAAQIICLDKKMMPASDFFMRKVLLERAQVLSACFFAGGWMGASK